MGPARVFPAELQPKQPVQARFPEAWDFLSPYPPAHRRQRPLQTSRQNRWKYRSGHRPWFSLRRLTCWALSEATPDLRGPPLALLALNFVVDSGGSNRQPAGTRRPLSLTPSNAVPPGQHATANIQQQIPRSGSAGSSIKSPPWHCRLSRAEHGANARDDRRFTYIAGKWRRVMPKASGPRRARGLFSDGRTPPGSRTRVRNRPWQTLADYAVPGLAEKSAALPGLSFHSSASAGASPLRVIFGHCVE